MDWLFQLHILGEIGLSMIFGGIIGIEREIADKPAGIRTIMLVAGGSTLLMKLGDIIIIQNRELINQDIVRIDPTRIIQAIIAGISFLGAGTIIRRVQDNQIEGLTTAASIFLAGGIGICVALQQTILAFGVSVLGFLVMRVLGIIQKRLS